MKSMENLAAARPGSGQAGAVAAEPSREHWAVLAGARFYLAFIIFVAHFGLTIPAGADLMRSYPEYLFGRQLGPLGAILGFLAISGYSIGHSYRQPAGFYGRRVGRILPTLAFAALFFAAGLRLAGPITTTSGDIAYPPSLTSLLSTLAGLNGFAWPSFLGPAWSLSVELFFYAATPLLAVLPTLGFGCLMLLSAALYWLNDALGIGSLAGARHGIAAASLFWAWGAGFLFERHRGPVSAFVLAATGGFLLGKLNYEGGTYAIDTWLIACGAIAAGGLVPVRSRLVLRLLNYLGDLSYPLFLIHYPVIVLMNGILGITDFLVLLLSSIGLSAVCLHLVERPLRRRIAGLNCFAGEPERFAPHLVMLPVALALLGAIGVLTP